MTIMKTCWVDFRGSDRQLLPQALAEAGFELHITDGDLQVWHSARFGGVGLELLEVGSIPREPVSHVQNLSSSQVDRDRRRLCVPMGMDPFYRLVIYPDTHANAGEHVAALADVKRTLTTALDRLTRMAGTTAGPTYVWQNEP